MRAGSPEESPLSTLQGELKIFWISKWEDARSQTSFLAAESKMTFMRRTYCLHPKRRHATTDDKGLYLKVSNREGFPFWECRVDKH